MTYNNCTIFKGQVIDEKYSCWRAIIEIEHIKEDGNNVEFILDDKDQVNTDALDVDKQKYNESILKFQLCRY